MPTFTKQVNIENFRYTNLFTDGSGSLNDNWKVENESTQLLPIFFDYILNTENIKIRSMLFGFKNIWSFFFFAITIYLGTLIVANWEHAHFKTSGWP